MASMVVLTDGVPQPRQYRRFKIRSVEGNNDFASMAEVVRRRFSRLKTDETGDSFNVIPDLVVIRRRKGAAFQRLRGAGRAGAASECYRSCKASGGNISSRLLLSRWCRVRSLLRCSCCKPCVTRHTALPSPYHPRAQKQAQPAFGAGFRCGSGSKA